jgi:hypothetical protein
MEISVGVVWRGGNEDGDTGGGSGAVERVRARVGECSRSLKRVKEPEFAMAC